MNMHLKFEPLDHSFQVGPPEAILSLRRLFMRVRSELEAYHRSALEDNDLTRVGLAESVLEWLNTEGVGVYSELLRKIRCAGHEDQERMRRSIDAAMRLVDATKQGSDNEPHTRDMVWDWCKEVFPSLRRAFRRFPDYGETAEPEDTDRLVRQASEGNRVTAEARHTWQQPAEVRGLHEIEGTVHVAA